MSYKLLHPLESGPDVSVYLVQDRWKSGISKVLTLFPVDLSNKFQRLEFEMLLSWRQSLDHPLLVPVHDVGFRGRRVGFISDFVDGCDLSKKVKTLGSWKERRILALQLSELLAYLHRKRFLCGVLKPSQLFVLSETRLMANFLVPEGKYRGETGNRDWIRYAAPEFLTTESVNHQTDLYALGMVFYHLFTGQEPYSEQDPNSLKVKQLVASPLRTKKAESGHSR